MFDQIETTTGPKATPAEKARAWREQNPEKTAAIKKRYREKHPEKAHDYYEAHKAERIKAAADRKRALHPRVPEENAVELKADIRKASTILGPDWFVCLGHKDGPWCGYGFKLIQAKHALQHDSYSSRLDAEHRSMRVRSRSANFNRSSKSSGSREPGYTHSVTRAPPFSFLRGSRSGSRSSSSGIRTRELRSRCTRM